MRVSSREIRNRCVNVFWILFLFVIFFNVSLIRFFIFVVGFRVIFLNGGLFRMFVVFFS